MRLTLEHFGKITAIPSGDLVIDLTGSTYDTYDCYDFVERRWKTSPEGTIDDKFYVSADPRYPPRAVLQTFLAKYPEAACLLYENNEAYAAVRPKPVA